MNRIGIVLIATSFLAAACSIPDDLDTPCRLTTALPDGGSVPIPTSTQINTTFDFISTGNSDCEDLICIRLANAATGFNDDTDGFWHGRCSNNCIVDEANSHSTDCGEASKGLVCAQLSFDQAFIDNFCATDPNDCSTIFGTDTSATFCIDPNGTTNASGT